MRLRRVPFDPWKAGLSRSFRDWLFRQERVDDRIGDLARDAITDACWRGTTALSLRRHILSDHGGSEQVIETTHIAERLHSWA